MPLRILVTGAEGFLGPFAVAALQRAGHTVRTLGRRGGDIAVDLCAKGMVPAVLEAEAPDRVLNLAALARLADCERDPLRAAAVNSELPEQLAARLGPRLLHVSTDLVFDGRRAPYDEAAPVGPLSAYGLSKAEGEERARRHGGRVVRLPLLFGPDPHGRGATASLRAALGRGETVPLFPNEYRTPLHAADAAQALAELLPLCGAPTLLHLPGPERCSRWELGRRFAARHGLPLDRLQAVECQDQSRPRDVALAGVYRAPRSLDAMLADA